MAVRTLILSLLVGSAPLGSTADLDRHTPQTARGREEIIAAAERIKGFGALQWAEFRQEGRRLFVISYCPFSGRAATYAHVYHDDGKRWVRLLERLIESTHQITAEMPLGKSQLVLRGYDGNVVLTVSLENINRSEL